MTFFDHGGSTAPIDLQLPETFHRLKRTLLLFCSILIVLGLSQGVQTRELKLTMVDVSLHVELIRTLLWLAAVYYLIGFAMEVRIVRLVNSEAMLGAGMKTVEGAFKKIGQNVVATEGTVEQASAAVSSLLKDITSTTLVSVAPSTLTDQLTAFGIPMNEEALRSRLTNMEAMLGNAVADQRQSHKDVLDKTERMTLAVETYGKRHEELQGLLARLEKDLGKLSRRIHGDRRISFWAWEIGGATFAFLIATVINAQHLVRNTADFAISVGRALGMAV
jgi:hypothetical protein